jgi:hypothetical protein
MVEETERYVAKWQQTNKQQSDDGSTSGEWRRQVVKLEQSNKRWRQVVKLEGFRNSGKGEEQRARVFSFPIPLFFFIFKMNY